MVAEGLESAKNLAFIAEDDFNTWDMFAALLFWISTYVKATEKVVNKQEPKQIEASS